MSLKGAKGRRWPCGLEWPCLFIIGCWMPWQELVFPSLGPGGEGLSAALSGCVCVDLYLCVFLGLCVPWLSSLLVTLRPGTVRSPPPPASNFSTPRPSTLGPWQSEKEAKGQRSLVKMGSGARRSTPESAPTLGMRRGNGSRALPMGTGRPGCWAALLPHPQAWLKSRCVC